jgi:phosphoribosylformimino-5-aminoimidazole carboxamide ribotide isomerase
VLILPAIDLRGGRCVRLRQGDYDRETVYSDDPAAMAEEWVSQGATYLHLVDLDGARAGQPVNGDSIRRIVQAGGVPCQLGGGLRSEDDIAAVLDWGIERVVVGTRAVNEPAWLEAIARQFPGKVLVDISARAGRLATEGWQKVSGRTVFDFARECASWPLAAIVYTDVSRDGMLQGPDLETLAELVRCVRLGVIASGGITTAQDIRRLKEAGPAGCIVGRALYEGKLSLKEALEIASN